MRLLRRLLEQLGSDLDFDESDIMTINNQYFLLSKELKTSVIEKNSLVYAGEYIGKDQRRFVPSSILLERLGRESSTRKAYVEQDAAWLFICGKDIFEENILSFDGELVLGNHYLIMLGSWCLGYGRFETSADKRVIRNMFDIGDFLRREDS
ncbi:hypothetical protein GF319_02365 [Candidatus Bathyarchaeota archaeon]|jgi:ribosome biogenesis protein Nip4|nr:hypothetical protein [Candidatus Bathyarchaeota archaeon]